MRADSIPDTLVGMFTGCHVLVVGADVTGRSVAAGLGSLGATVTVTDARPEALAALRLPRVRLRLGLLEPPPDTDLVVTSPVPRPDSPLLTAATNRGIEVIGDVELAWRLSRRLSTPPVWLAVTGTDGKTTTVRMLESILRAADVDTVACGNLGLLMVDAVLAGHPVLAVELSSSQLYWQTSMRPHAAVLLNLAEDHLSWHDTMDAYAAAKSKVYRNAELPVYNADDEWSTRIATATGRRDMVSFTLGEPTGQNLGVRDESLVHGDLPLCPVDQIRLAGPHNVSNALAAAALGRTRGIAPRAVRAGLSSFEPPPHRIQLVAEARGVRYVSDSKATNAHAASTSLSSHDSVVWIAGGQVDGCDIAELVAECAHRLRGVVVLGRDRELFRTALARHAPNVPVYEVVATDHEAMTTAVRAACGMALPGDVVLLAPAAKSYDMFDNFVHRGETFAGAVTTMLAEGRQG
jgi:UDP-N-acetylmuramoylalanine--D-glutamate ligase